MRIRGLVAVACAGALLAGCTSVAAALPVGISGESTPEPRVSADQLDALTYVIEVTAPTVVAGGEVEYVFTVRNDSGGPITIPSCETSVGPRGIVPADEPEAELWMNMVVDCGGPHVLAAGDEESWTESVYARDKYGTAYEPGPHLVGRKVRGVQGRLLVPITVVAPNEPS